MFTYIHSKQAFYICNRFLTVIIPGRNSAIWMWFTKRQCMV